MGSWLTPASALPDKTEITVHYTRFDGDYAGWNLWLWPKGGNGAAYEFTQDDAFGKVAKVTVPGTAKVEEIGIIVRLGDWKAKDITQDRYIKEFKDGKAEIWLVQGDSAIYYSKPRVSTKFMAAEVSSFDSLEVTLNSKITPAVFSDGLVVTLGGSKLPIKSVTTLPAGQTNANKYIISLDGKLNFVDAIEVSHPEIGAIPASPSGLFGTKDFEDSYTYQGNDLGSVYSKSETKFRLWAPTANAAQLVVYQTSSASSAIMTYTMSPSVKGTWTYTLPGDQDLTIYTYRVRIGNSWNESIDPYAKASTINGDRGVVVDLTSTNPSQFEEHTKPDFSGVATDAIFYELHVRDLSMDKDSGITNRGKFLGLTETGTTTPDKKTKTGVDAILDLGVTHLQLLPIYDYKTVDESRSDQFNWGYDPQNFNVPEGSYSTKPADPKNRIYELKQTIQTLHTRGLRVVMDVVYNHVFEAGAHSFESLVPGYFFRKEADGNFANGTGVGNEVASERSMVRKYIVDSASYWADEYRLDGFRFDLMGILDVETMNQIRTEIDRVDPTFLIIGEGWNMGNILNPEQRANQLNASKMPRIAHFNDGIRDGLKGSVFDSSDTGWASGKTSAKSKVMAGIAGETRFSKTIAGGWGEINPEQSVSYVEAHDNLTLFDKLQASMPRASVLERKRVFALASGTAILAQGVPFLHAGQEFMRSKNGDENSYKSSDNVNSLKWAKRYSNREMVSYFKGLIEIRKSSALFRISSSAEIRKVMKFSSTPSDVIAYSLNPINPTLISERFFVIHNSSKKSKSVALPTSGNWEVLAEGFKASKSGLKVLRAATKVQVGPQSSMVLRLPLKLCSQPTGKCG